MIKIREFLKNTDGDAVVEATILFPIIIMIFAVLVILAMYLPTRAVLQHATQYAATAISTEKSDTWLYYDENDMKYKWKNYRFELNNVYINLFNSIVPNSNEVYKAEEIVRNIENKSLSMKSGSLEVNYEVFNCIVYKEIVITATRKIPVMVNLSFIGFPKEIEVKVTSTTVVQNGDEFIRNTDIAVDIANYLDDKYKISEKINSMFEKVRFLWKEEKEVLK